MWNDFNKQKPTEKGWYVCTVEVKNQQRYVMELYWYPETRRFIDNIRQNVCDTYTVMDYLGKRVYDMGQDRTASVVAWQDKPEPYMDGFVKKIIDHTEFAL
jgi:hypothetical protein